MSSAIRLFRNVMGDEFRQRFRAHYGSHQECQYGLTSFGIPNTILPLLPSNDDVHAHHVDLFVQNQIQKSAESLLMSSSCYESLQTLAEQQRHSDSNGNNGVGSAKERLGTKGVNPTKGSHGNGSSKYYIPKDCDILLGRGRAAQLHPGNKELLQIATERLDEYKKADRFTKTCISLEIIQRVEQHNGGKFLEYNKKTNQWEPVQPALRVRDKVSNLFRSLRKPQRQIQLQLKNSRNNKKMSIVADNEGGGGGSKRVKGSSQLPNKDDRMDGCGSPSSKTSPSKHDRNDSDDPTRIGGTSSPATMLWGVQFHDPYCGCCAAAEGDGDDVAGGGVCTCNSCPASSFSAAGMSVTTTRPTTSPTATTGGVADRNLNHHPQTTQNTKRLRRTL